MIKRSTSTNFVLFLSSSSAVDWYCGPGLKQNIPTNLLSNSKTHRNDLGQGKKMKKICLVIVTIQQRRSGLVRHREVGDCMVADPSTIDVTGKGRGRVGDGH
jgi:hypothetical protein